MEVQGFLKTEEQMPKCMNEAQKGLGKVVIFEIGLKGWRSI